MYGQQKIQDVVGCAGEQIVIKLVYMPILIHYVSPVDSDFAIRILALVFLIAGMVSRQTRYQAYV